MNRLSIRRVAAAAVAAGAAIAAVAASAPAATADPTTLTIAYDAVGTSFIAKPSSTVSLGPTVLTTTLNLNTGKFTGSLPFPPTTSTFKVAGFIPVTATATFIPFGQVKGVLNPDPVPNVKATALYYINLSNVTVGGIPAPVGSDCQTASPVSISVHTPKGGRFFVLSGGKIAGTYTIGDFANCGLTTGLINLLVPGSGNTVSLTLSNGRLAG